MDATSEPDEGSLAPVADLWRFYVEHAQHARDHEGLRATVSSTLAAIAAAVVGLAGVGGLSRADIPAGLVVVVLSSLGVALSIKHYERFKMHTAIMREVRAEIDRLQGERRASGLTMQQARDRGVARHREKFGVFRDRTATAPPPTEGESDRSKSTASPWVDRIRLHVLWLGLPVSIGLIGVLVIVLSLVGVSSE